MNVASALLVVAAAGVNFGWQPSKEDPKAYEVTMQVEPELVDTLKTAPQIPIESHVPAEITPIRNVRVVVGSGELPRTTIAAGAAKSDRVVRGQGDTPQTRTANMPAADTWGGSTYPPSGLSAPTNERRYEQRGATIGAPAPVTTAQAPPPSLLQRTQNGVTETATTLRDGVETGIQQANQQISRTGTQIGDSASNAAHGASQQAQQMWPAPPPGVATPSAAPASSSIAPPPNVMGTSNGWTSVRPDVAPPPLSLPPLLAPATPAATSVATNPTFPAPPGGPSFPSAIDSRAPLHSVLTDPTTTSTAGSNVSPPPPSSSPQANWGAGWGSTAAPATQTRVQPEVPRPPATDAAAEARRWADANQAQMNAAAKPAGDDRYAPQPAAAGKPGDLFSSLNQPPANAPAAPANPAAGQPQQNMAGQPMPTTAAQNPNGVPPIGYAGPANPAIGPAQPGDGLPWWPLFGVSVALAGSLGANLFLGWSYADARHRYLTLVRKTTNAFQKTAGIAA